MTTVDVVIEDGHPANADLILRPGRNLFTGESKLEKSLGSLSSLEQDLLLLAASIYATDLATKRGERELITREIELRIPLVNHAHFQNQLRDIQYMLYILGHDAWSIEIVPRDGHPESGAHTVDEHEGKVLLFSGGLDSLAAAVNIGVAGESGYLISHITGNRVVSQAQLELAHNLENDFPGQFSHMPIRVGGRNRVAAGYPFPIDREREDSQRTRSFLFLTLAGIAARKLGIRDIIVIAENGQLAIHLPLTAGRISAFSTHTAHPEFIYNMANFLSNLLSVPINITNPFTYMTKSEVVSIPISRNSIQIGSSVSCWMSARLFGGRTHCGSCIPCLIRRISLESNGVALDEYSRDMFNEDLSLLPPNDDGKRNLVDLAEFVKIFDGTLPDSALELYYPELVNQYIDFQRAVDMYRRFSDEARSVLGSYPILGALLN